MLYSGYFDDLPRFLLPIQSRLEFAIARGEDSSDMQFLAHYFHVQLAARGIQ